MEMSSEGVESTKKKSKQDLVYLKESNDDEFKRLLLRTIIDLTALAAACVHIVNMRIHLND